MPGEGWDDISWKPIVMCDPGTFVVDMDVKFVANKSLGDDMAVTALRIICDSIKVGN